MTRTALRSAAAAALAALAVAAAIIAADFTAPASATTPATCSGYIVAQRLEDGRVQVLWQEGEINGWWNGWWVVPNQRYIPTDAQVDRWLRSSTVRVGGFGYITIDARLRSDGRIEFAYTRIQWNDYRDPTDREQILPELRYFPADAPVGRWVYSNKIHFPCQFHPLGWQFPRP